MCYHTSQTKTTSQLEQRFKVKRDPDFNIGETDFTFYHSNGFAHQNLLMIPQEDPKIITPAMWGLMPSNRTGAQHKEYYKESIRFGSGLNARSEKLFDHFIYRHSVFTQRCIVPVDGFFEPFEHRKKKYPVYIGRKDRESMALAGIYTRTRDGYVTMAILTREASPFLGRIHNVKKRQPVMLPGELESGWLDPHLDSAGITDLLHTAFNDKDLLAHTVSKDLYRTTTDSNTPEIIRQEEYPELLGISWQITK